MNAVSYLQYSGPGFFLHFSSTFVWPGPSLVVFIPLGEHGAALPQPGWVKQLNPWPVVRYSPAIISLEHTMEQKIHCYFRITTLAINGLADTYPWRIQLITSPENLRAYSSVGTLRSECQNEIEFKPREDQNIYLDLLLFKPSWCIRWSKVNPKGRIHFFEHGVRRGFPCICAEIGIKGLSLRDFLVYKLSQPL